MAANIWDRVPNLMREAADRFIIPRFRALNGADVTAKAAGDYVTVADREAEEFLIDPLRGLVAGSIVIGEESTFADPNLLDRLGDEHVWLVDPVDGTLNFVEGRTDFAVMVCLLRKGVMTAAWVLFPATSDLYCAELGAGATLNGRRITSPRAGRALVDARGALVYAHMPEQTKARMAAAALGLHPASAQLYAASAECRAMLNGELDFAVYWRTMPWDHAPTALILREAGGLCQRWDGSNYFPADGKRGLVVSPNSDIATMVLGWLPSAGSDAE